MKLTFIGAAHEVTGSCHLLQACDKNILIDYGMEQGINLYENAPLPVSPSEIDYVFLTHAHIDHSGMLPQLYSMGFRGRVLTTDATRDLCNIMLKDSAHIQMFEAEWKNRKNKRAGKPLILPSYDMEDALGVLELFQSYSYGESIQVCSGIQIRFSDVGHLLGSASIEIWVVEKGIQKKIVCSGDIGNLNQPLIRDPQYLDCADYVIMESTYGDRTHGERPEYVTELASIINSTFQKGGNVVIPSFAVGRTQELLYFIRAIKAQNLVPDFPAFEVYVDSPLAIEATNIFNRNQDFCFDEEALELLNQGINPLTFPGLKVSLTSEESKAINFNQQPKVIISASGMCEAGRIRHHLKHNLWRPESTILFVGYQAKGTLGRTLVDGQVSEVKLFGETIEVHADIKVLAGVSGHADQQGLITWLRAMNPKPERVFIVHGEDTVCDNFAHLLHKEYGYHTEAPYSGSSFDLAQNVWITQAAPRPIVRGKSSVSHANDVFSRLLAAGQRLLTVIRHNEGGANKDLAKFTSQIHSLCDKWER